MTGDMAAWDETEIEIVVWGDGEVEYFAAAPDCTEVWGQTPAEVMQKLEDCWRIFN